MWVRIDDHVPQHPKFLHAGREAAWFWVCGNCYCNKYLTDGFIAERALSALSPGAPFRRLTERLVLAGLWDRTEGGYTVHDYHDHNPRSEQIKSKRAADRIRKQRAPDSEHIPQNFHAESNATPNGFHGARGRAGADARDRDPSPIPSQSPPNQMKIALVTDEIRAKAGRFLEKYPQIYADERRGAHFQLKPVLHFMTACEIVQGWPDEKRLELMFRTFCKLPSSEKMAWPGTPAQFLHLAPEIDVRLRQAGA